MNAHHARLRFRIADRLLDELGYGEALMQLSVTTPKGDVQTDVAWASPDRREALKTTDGILAPEICVKIVSSDDEHSTSQLRDQFFESEAEEVWICDSDGHVQFFGPDGERNRSERVPGFPPTLSP